MMWGTVVVLALVAMADPVRNGWAILLLSGRRPMRSLLAFWVGGTATVIVVGFCVLFVLRDFTLGIMHRVAFTAASASAGHLRIVIGLLALLIATALFAYRSRTPAGFSRLPPRVLGAVDGGHLWVALVAGLGAATPWEYFVALTAMTASGAGAGAKVSAVVVFAVMAFAIAEIPLISYLAAQGRTDAVVLQMHNWVRAHRRRILALVVAAGGVFLLANGLNV